MDKMRIHEMLERMTEWCLNEISKGVECVDTAEMGAAIDMVKDLADAEKNVWEKCYYEEIVEAMKDAGRAGYDNWRYSSGRFAPTGHGHFSGYTIPMQDEHMMRRMERDIPRMGYVDEAISHERGEDRYGMPYHRYLTSRRHFHESGSPEHKMEMDKNAKEHMTNAIASMRDIWGDADPEMKKKMKTDLMALINEMN